MLTVAEIAAWLGMTQSGVRNIISRHGIPSRGKQGRHKLYAAEDITRHAGAHDRLTSRRSADVGH